MVDTAIILAAGRGSRLEPEGGEKEFSKPLIHVGGRSLLRRTIAACVEVGVAKIVVVTGYRRDLVEEELAALRLDTKLDAVHNPEWRRPNGLSLLAARGAVEGDFALLMADHLFEVSILADLCAMATSVPCTLAVDYKLDSILDMEDATKVRTEGQQICEIGKALLRFNAVDCGLFRCKQQLFAALEQSIAAEGLSISDAMRLLARRGEFDAFDIGDRIWQDVDTPEMAAHAERLFGEG